VLTYANIDVSVSFHLQSFSSFFHIFPPFLSSVSWLINYYNTIWRRFSFFRFYSRLETYTVVRKFSLNKVWFIFRMSEICDSFSRALKSLIDAREHDTPVADTTVIHNKCCHTQSCTSFENDVDVAMMDWSLVWFMLCMFVRGPGSTASRCSAKRVPLYGSKWTMTFRWSLELDVSNALSGCDQFRGFDFLRASDFSVGKRIE
jgi:hypothetical protein